MSKKKQGAHYYREILQSTALFHLHERQIFVTRQQREQNPTNFHVANPVTLSNKTPAAPALSLRIDLLVRCYTEVSYSLLFISCIIWVQNPEYWVALFHFTQ